MSRNLIVFDTNALYQKINNSSGVSLTSLGCASTMPCNSKTAFAASKCVSAISK